MTITSYSFNEIDEDKELKDFVIMCIEHGYNFTVGYTGDVRYVEVDDISKKDADVWAEYAEDERTEDEEDDSYEECGDIEMGFNPYMGCYDYDC